MGRIKDKVVSVIVLTIVTVLSTIIFINIPTLNEKKNNKEHVVVTENETIHWNNSNKALIGKVLSVGDIIRQNANIYSAPYQVEYRYHVEDNQLNRMGFNHIGNNIYEQVVPENYNGRITYSGKWKIVYSYEVYEYYYGQNCTYYVAAPYYSLQVEDVAVTVVDSIEAAPKYQWIEIETELSRDDYAIVFGDNEERIYPEKVADTENRYKFKMPYGDVTIRPQVNHKIINRNNLIGTVISEGETITQDANEYGQQHRMEFRPSSKSYDFRDRQMFFRAYDNTYRHDVRSSYCIYSTDSKKWIVLFNYQNANEDICYFVAVPYYKITAEEGIVVEKNDEIINDLKKAITGAGVDEKIFITTDAPKESLVVTYGESNTTVEIFEETGVDNQYYFIMPNGDVTITTKKLPLDPPNVGKVDETIYGKEDGEITNVDSTMEYRKEGDNTYTNIEVTKISNLSAGKYYVRYKGDKYHTPSPDTEVNIGNGRMLVVTLKADGKVIGTKEVPYKGAIGNVDIPEKEGYTKTPPKWDKDGTNITEDIEINAVYTINTYTVTFVDENGVYKTVTYEHCEKVDMPEPPKKEGYKVKWETSLDKATGDTIIKAVYVKNSTTAANTTNTVDDTSTLDATDTGDKSNINLWRIIAVISGGLMLGIIIFQFFITDKLAKK